MCLFRSFYPDEYCDSAYEIDYKKLYDEGCRGVIYDIDNTLVPQDAPADDKSRALLKDLLAMGYGVVLLSNNKEPRVKMFCDGCEGLDVKYIANAGKPLTKSYVQSMEIMGTDLSNTIFVGDQLFTDIYGANRAKVRSFLVKPIDPKEEPQIVFKRKLEKIVLKMGKKG